MNSFFQNIGNSNRTYFIAEIGNNHNGDLNKAIRLIDIAHESGADCVKFQMRHLPSVYRDKSLEKKGDDLSVEYVLDLLEKFELDIEDHKKLHSYAKEHGLDYACTPWDEKSIDILEEFDLPFYKVSSADLTNHFLIEKLIKTKKSILISTGMSYENEILETIQLLKSNNVDFGVLHCNSTYPAPFHDINLKYINRLYSFHDVVGYSGHERGKEITMAAVALGAKIVERHITLDRNMEGPDHAASLEEEDLKDLIFCIRNIEESLGSDHERKISQGELMNRENLSKSLIAAHDIKLGTIIEDSMIKSRSPGLGLKPNKYKNLIGKKICRDMKAEDFFFDSDINEKENLSTEFKFSRPWGIPVRFFDFNDFNEISSPDFFEFHLSYADLDLDPFKFFNKSDKGFIVHAPELFKGSKLMDLASRDKDYLEFSIKETQKVIDLTKRINELFPNQKCPGIIANIGGFSMDEPLPEDDKNELYEIFYTSLSKLNFDDVELLPQTMAPFPWHFGGQRYQNLFVKSNEIRKICEDMNLRICLDISHSALTCNYYNESITDFIDDLSNHVGHMHISDSKDLNGEGLQIHDGDLDFIAIAKSLENIDKNVGFIPEIWQGHKDNGKGFWIALEKLQNTGSF